MATVFSALNSSQLNQSFLKQYLPNTEVWAYGSRVKGTASSYSDLDLVAFTCSSQQSAVFDLKEAFEESDLPFRVDLFSWGEIPKQFQENIKRDKVLLSSSNMY
ncbi:MAG: nucleotidyltransferase domain-containing protein [Methylococcaceae bacterium]|nr:nucleotidyltransferase domain-containing protein [Methylococcaceae bacterium]